MKRALQSAFEHPTEVAMGIVPAIYESAPLPMRWICLCGMKYTG
jgi:hypothetical protein